MRSTPRATRKRAMSSAALRWAVADMAISGGMIFGI
jgi:hypothetical protein